MMELFVDYDDTITKKDIYAIAITLALAFFIGLTGGSFTVMMCAALPTYIAIRYLQTQGMI